MLNRVQNMLSIVESHPDQRFTFSNLRVFLAVCAADQAPTLQDLMLNLCLDRNQVKSDFAILSDMLLVRYTQDAQRKVRCLSPTTLGQRFYASLRLGGAAQARIGISWCDPDVERVAEPAEAG